MINLSEIKNILPKEGASDIQLGILKKTYFNLITPDYIDLLKCSNGFETEEGVVIYGIEELEERQGAYEIEFYAPGYLAIGDDSGGAVIIFKENAVLTVDAGSMSPKDMVLISGSITQWVLQGCPLDESEEDEGGISYGDTVDIYLELKPNDLKFLLKLKKKLYLNTSIGDLKNGLNNLPICLLSEVPYGKYKKRLDEINDEFECLSIKKHV